MCICMEFMDASVKKFYQAMHSMDELEFDKVDTLIRRIAHDVSLLSLIYSHLQFSRQIASGLSYLEIKEIVHRDIKPANMLINKNGVIKLCDFGISRTFSELKSEFGGIGGTENYMPPTSEYTIRDDMWALGISLLEVSNGKNPFEDDESCGKFITIIMWKPSVPEMISDDMQQLILHL